MKFSVVIGTLAIICCTIQFTLSSQVLKIVGANGSKDPRYIGRVIANAYDGKESVYNLNCYASAKRSWAIFNLEYKSTVESIHLLNREDKFYISQKGLKLEVCNTDTEPMECKLCGVMSNPAKGDWSPPIKCPDNLVGNAVRASHSTNAVSICEISIRGWRPTEVLDIVGATGSKDPRYIGRVIANAYDGKESVYNLNCYASAKRSWAIFNLKDKANVESIDLLNREDKFYISQKGLKLEVCNTDTDPMECQLCGVVSKPAKGGWSPPIKCPKDFVGNAVKASHSTNAVSICEIVVHGWGL